MGGHGSGRYIRHNKRLKLEFARKIDISMISKDLQSGGPINLIIQEKYTGEYTSPIYGVFSPGSLTLHEHIDNETANKTQIRISRTACNYGGYRSWFHCPTCDAKINSLFLASNQFGCRACHKLAYKSQSMSTYDRKVDQYHQLMRRIDQINDRGPSAQQRGMQDRTLRKMECRLSKIRADLEQQYLAMALGLTKKTQ